MLILFIAQEPPLAHDAVATGNAIRTAQLEGALSRAGHTIHQVWLSNESNNHQDAFQSRDELQSRITRSRPDVILLSYWELLELLPFDLYQPVVVDFVAPRPLELLFEHPERVGPELKLLQSNLCKCDLLLTGNEAQRDLLWFSLLQAGFDLRGCDPVQVVPLAADPAGRPASDPAVDGWTLVSGGVSWPWRNSEDYWQAIQAMKNDLDSAAPRLVLFGGQYRWHEDKPLHSGAGHAVPQHQIQGLAPYSHFSRFLLASAHIGLEVACKNIERRYSQSFRSLEFLRHGLPLICNDYLPMAKLISNYKAGWTINRPEQIAGLLREIMAQPEEWKTRSENALRLVEEVLNPDVAIEPLLDWLELPSKVPLLPSIKGQYAPTVLGKPAWPQRLKHQLDLIRRVFLSRLFVNTSDNELNKQTDNIVIVTRRDLFPDDHGAAVKIVETARGLSQHGRKVGIVSDDRTAWWLFEDGQKSLQRLPFWLRFLSLPGPLNRLLHHSKDIPESNSFLYLPLTDGCFFWHCLYVGKKLKAGILQAEFPAYAKPCIKAREILNAAVVLVEHNVEYNRLKAQLPMLSDTQYRNLRAIEIDLCNHSDAVICVSDNDRQQLLHDGVSPRLMHTIPHGFKPEPYNLPGFDTLRQDFGLTDAAILIAFHGTFSYPPNRDALQVFADILLPQLIDGIHNFHVIAIGRNPPKESPHPNIHFTGSVDEVAPWLKACDLAVIPLREGGGTRMKIIDCFAAGLPVVTTSKGIEGIPVVDGREAIISDDWNSMTNEILALASPGEKRDSLVSSALKFASEMDWNSITKRYLNIFSAIRR